MGLYQFKRRQFIPASLDKVWEFISSPANLKKITPDYMGFDILDDSLPQEMYPGMIIRYHVKPVLGIKTLWVTEITHVQDKKFFVDEQRVGPYKIWHHQHILEEKDGGVDMHDIVAYQPPMGVLGNIANSLFIESKLKEIFDYRIKAVEREFGFTSK